MHFIVKNTTNINILDLFCPYSCQKCGKLGNPLCSCCKKHIVKQGLRKQYLQEYLESDWCDLNGQLPFMQSFACGWRDQALGELVENYKYHSSRAIGPILGEILDQTLPDLSQNIIVVPLPTATQHIRARGFDHTLKIAKNLARRRGWQYQKLLARAKNTVQVGASAEARQTQAEEAYQLKNITKQDNHNSPIPRYLLLDDVWTTGASLCAASRILQESGITKQQIYGAVLVVSR